MSEKQFYRIYLMRTSIDRVDLYEPDRAELTLIEPELSMDVNSSGSLKFIMPPEHIYYNEIKLLSSTIAVWEDRSWLRYGEAEPDQAAENDEVEPDQDALIWVGRPVRISTDFYQRKTVECEGGIAFLSDSVQDAQDWGSKTLSEVFGILLSGHNSQVEEMRRINKGTVSVPSATIRFKTNYSNTLETLRSLTQDDKYGGWLRLRQDPEDYEWYLDWLNDYSDSAEQDVQYGLNLLDLKQVYSGETIATRVIPLGKNGLTIESVNSGNVALVDAVAAAKYGTITRVLEYSDCDSAATLKSLGQAWLNAQGPLSLEVNAADLYIVGGVVEPFRLGQLVRVLSDPHGVNMVLPITRMVTRLEDGRKTVTLGISGQKALTSITRAAVVSSSGGGHSGGDYLPLTGGTVTGDVAFRGNVEEGDETSCQGAACHAEGAGSVAGGSGVAAAHAEGGTTTASGSYAHAEGQATTASGEDSHAEGYGTTASNDDSHAEGNETTASGIASHAEGKKSKATNQYAHAEGDRTTASGNSSHAEGGNTTAWGPASHAEGYLTEAHNDYCHSEGRGSHAYGTAAHAEGLNTATYGKNSHAQNEGTIARGDSQTALGKYNVQDSNNTYAIILGNGSADNSRSNALTVDWNGNVAVAGDISEGGTSLSAKYAGVSHNHDSAYASLNHNHDSVYASINHNHDTAYAAIGHNHDSSYANINHTHNYLPLYGGTLNGNLAVVGNVDVGHTDVNGYSEQFILTCSNGRFTTPIISPAAGVIRSPVTGIGIMITKGTATATTPSGTLVITFETGDMRSYNLVRRSFGDTFYVDSIIGPMGVPGYTTVTSVAISDNNADMNGSTVTVRTYAGYEADMNVSGDLAVGGDISEGGATLSSLYAGINHNHDSAYLPLTGGSISGTLSIGGQQVRANFEVRSIYKRNLTLGPLQASWETVDISDFLNDLPSGAFWWPIQYYTWSWWTRVATAYQSGSDMLVNCVNYHPSSTDSYTIEIQMLVVY